MKKPYRHGKKLAGLAIGLIVAALSACGYESAIGAKSVVRTNAVESRSIVMKQDGSALITANIDVPTISIVDPKTKKVTSEIPVGSEPRNVALSPDEKTAYVTAMRENAVYVVDLEKQKTVGKINVKEEPFAVLSSQDGSKLFVTAYRSNAVDVIDPASYKLIKQIRVENEPRGLALTADGKELFVSHFVHGAVSVIDTDSLAVKKVIPLAETPAPASHDGKVSQGLPGMVENMTISPDGKQLWLPHILTNVNVPIQFESTIFPVVSIIDIPKLEELTNERKHLFKQMNIVNVKNQPEVFSNPSDIGFLPDGSKAFVLMGGSEDLVTIDLKRGGKATQLLRRIPGDNPRGLSLTQDGKTLYVHNAMSHDLATIETGGSDAYKKAKVVGSNLKLIAKDPLPPDVRAGKVMFYSANSDKFAADITGKNWMSCASCHFDGEINGITMKTPKGPRNTPSNVLTTKTGLFTWDGSRDEFEDYLLTVQNEMGGMLAYDPAKPLPADVKKMYAQIFTYLDQPDSYPVPKSPYRNPDGSLTASAQLGQELFQGKAGCITCHAGVNFTDSDQAVNAQGKLTTDNMTKLHDVGTATAIDIGSPDGDPRGAHKNGRPANLYDTPTLRGVWATAPYLHDGSAKTIRDVLVARNTQNKHGNVKGLTDKEIDALAEYVLSIE
ncbi:c-type cytochrome [Brevibacillus fluminis]|uniref:c-type cytochrome n=1 Tax=Brevibacillus fluminis TaxID=511487 RepID=UPI003F89626B